MEKIILALVHNNDARYKHISSRLDLLRRKIKALNVEVVEVSQQPKIISNGILLTIFRKFLLWRINRRWLRYRLLKPRSIVLDLGIFIWRLITILFHKREEGRRLAIDICVADKHVRIWNYFLEKKADFLVCFEDDAIFSNTSNSKFLTVLKEAKKYYLKPIYFDLAGGCSLEVLRVSKLEIKKDRYRRYYKKPVTNTACCYLINNKTAELFTFYLLRYPWLRLIPIDWLMNELFILSADNNYKYICCHYWPHIFEHGSSLGNYKSWL